MKKIILISIILLLIPATLACINPTDSFAVEVILNKEDINYNLNKISGARNVISQSGNYIFQSQYNKNIATVLSELKGAEADICKTNCLSVRLQIPVETVTDKVPYFNILSKITGRKLILDENMNNYREWRLSYGKNQIELKRDRISIIITPIGAIHELFIEINEKLASCENCDGKCIKSQYGNSCVTKELKESIEDVLKFSGLIDNFEDILKNYRVISKGERIAIDLKPLIEPKLDWEEAIKQELVWLKKREIISIEDRDIQEISSKAERGKAGHNSRIVYSEKQEAWVYYYETENPLIIREINCQEFPLSNIPKNLPSFSIASISAFYFVPLAIFLLLALILVILLLIARTLAKRKKRKKSKQTK